MLLLLQQLVIEGHAGGHELGYSSLDDLLGQFRVLKLVAHGNLVSGTHQSRQIGLEGVVREPRHRYSPRGGTGTLREHDSQHLAGRQGVISVCLIKIAAPEQQHSLGVLRLHGEELLHHRCLGRFLLCHRSSLLNQANLTKIPVITTLHPPSTNPRQAFH